jgi:uncharacterized membrane protein
MAFFTGLVFFYALAWLVSLFFPDLLAGYAVKGTIAASAMFILVGISHFAKPEKLLAMLPESWPYRKAMNYVSGAAEILLGAGLLFENTRLYAAWGLLALLVAVFPANISVAIRKKDLYSISRLFFQPVYMVWIWFMVIR